MAIIDKFDNYIIAEVIKAYLIDGKSHRNIQREILDLPAPARGGGFVVYGTIALFQYSWR